MHPLVFLGLLALATGQAPNSENVQCTLDSGGEGECVPYYLCDNETSKVITDGKLLLDIRVMGECTFTELCCSLPEIVDEPITYAPPATTPRPSTTRKPTGTGPAITTARPPNGGTDPNTGTDVDVKQCGVRNPGGVLFSITGDKQNEAQFGEFPWMVAIMKEGPKIANKTLHLYQCGGSLIHPGVVMTAAHCVSNISDVKSLRVRAGEYDTKITTEYLPHQDRGVRKISINRNYLKDVLFNDIALLFLDTPMQLDEHIRTACLPVPQDKVRVTSKCFVAGWGKNEFGREGSYQNILKKVELPVVDFKKCQDDLRATRLGKRFTLHPSFMCAGGIVGRDACTGDGGSPLVCPKEDDPTRYEQVGIVAWGIGCNTATPGVYVNIPYLREWIDDEAVVNSISLAGYQDDALF